VIWIFWASTVALGKGDVRLRGVDSLAIRGRGEIMHWDLPDIG
jgi:hypothetical protein